MMRCYCISALLLAALAGCGDTPTSPKPQGVTYDGAEYNQTKALAKQVQGRTAARTTTKKASTGSVSSNGNEMKKVVEKPLPIPSPTLDGKIIEVERAALTFENTKSGSLGSHQFKYVFVKDEKGDTYVLIQPSSSPILKGDAKITYDASTQGIVRLQDILDKAETPRPKFMAVPNTYVKAHGFVKIIEYKTPEATKDGK